MYMNLLALLRIDKRLENTPDAFMSSVVVAMISFSTCSVLPIADYL